jgi:hypothetical protein
MANLGGSPLGLIGVKSTRDINGFSTFNGGKSRNINVANYNSGKDVYPIQNLEDNTYGGVKTENISQGTRSIFSGPTVIAPYGMIGTGRTENGRLDVKSKYLGVKKAQLHNDQVYDTSLLNIIERLSGTEAQLRPADFAYLKDIGVYPNNRLMIARRFTKPHLDNIFGKVENSLAMAIMISWRPQGENFLEISFGESWVDADADFKNVLNSLGKDFLGDRTGDKIGGALAVVPLPGFTESLQRQILTSIGLMEDNPNVPLPSGNPNLIKEAKRRKTIGYEGAGSGLKCTVSIKMECEWEQKFLSGIDPTIVFQDLLNKILVFGTSKSSNYGLTPKFEQTISKWTNDPGSIITDMVKLIKDGLAGVKKEIDDAIKNVKDTFTKDEAAAAEAKKNGTEEKKTADTAALDATSKLVDKLGSAEFESVIRRAVGKYKIEIQGIARALTGAPSTPWHITIGNPLRPIFCAGDMYMDQDVTLTLGPTLAFNDLPSSIKASFTLQNARAWGLQEIIAKFNAGSIRVSTTIKDDMQMNPGDKQNATDATKTGTKQDNAVGTASNTGVATSLQSGAVNQPAITPAVSNPVNSGAIATVAAGPQATDNTIPTFANNFGQSLPNTNDLTAAASSNIASAQAAAANVQNQATAGVAGVQNQVNTGVAGVQNQVNAGVAGVQNQVNTGVAGAQAAVNSAAQSTKDEVSSSVMNPIATQTSGVIPFDPSVFNNIPLNI